MIKVYCDTGGFTPNLLNLEREGLISVHQFKYENPNKRIRSEVIPSALTYADLANYTYEGLEQAVKTYADFQRNSEKFRAILGIIGNHNHKDARHIDSAYLTGCEVFLTSDKDDIWSHRFELKELLGITIFHTQTEWESFLMYIGNKVSKA